MKPIFSLLPDGYLPLYHGTRIRENDPLGSYSAASAAEVLALSESGIQSDYIYYAAPKTKDEIRSVIGKCRFVANDFEELTALNEAALSHNQPGYLETVGLRVIPAKYDNHQVHGFPENELPEYALKIRKLAGISIRGCFVEAALSGLSSKEAADYFHESYQTVKRMTTLLPCSMPYFCLCGILDALEEQKTKHPDTITDVLRAADIVGMQNKTAFYSRLLAD